MINNQIQSPVTGKNNVMSGQGTEDSKRESGKQQGGLFKLLMNSIQGGELNGKKGQSAGANFLGGNLTLKTQNEGEGQQSALHLLAGSGEESKDEKITLSKLLEGSGATVESPGVEVSNENENADADTASEAGENTTETADDSVDSEDDSAAGKQQPESEKAESDSIESETAELPKNGAQQTPPGAEVNTNAIKGTDTIDGTDGSTTQSDQNNSKVAGQESALTVENNSDYKSEKVAPSAKIAAKKQGAVLSVESGKVNYDLQGVSKQATALSGEAVTVESGSQGSSQQASVLLGEAVTGTTSDKTSTISQGSSLQTTKGDTKESNPLNGLTADHETAEKGNQAGLGTLFTGETAAEGEGLAERRSHSDGNSSVRPELVKSKGFVNELRALATVQGEQLIAGQQQRRVPTEQLNETDGSGTLKDGALIQEVFSALQNGSIEQVAAEIRSLKASQQRETRYSNYMSSFANRQEISTGGSELNSGSGSSISSTAVGSTATMLPVSAMVPTGSSVSSEMFDESSAILWKEQITEYFESNEKSSIENQAAAAFARLGDVPVTNISVRRSFAKGISQAILTSTGKGSKGSDVWQKHNFVLEDGKNIQVSAREVEGVLHLKLSSSFNELNKLLMDHENEIRDLLENELELNIDLQMEGGGDGDVADFFGGSSGQQSSSDNGPLDLGSLKKTTEQKVEEVVPKAVRKFGYNQMEWTV